ncbi:MAG: SEL1-like repeat protein [Verrucomicrobiales bacterium]|nr:SEL1-like repeat protein [Verrucomicrobiales bacterium]MCP5527283.1 SEL1-like repeat protein [Verrucomicrobiales bacterium]
MTGNAVATPMAPVFFQKPPRRPPTTAQLEERERVRLDFEIQCAERGMPHFQFSLAGRHLTGRGVPYDPEKALELLRKAAAQDHPQAQRVVREYEELLAAREAASGGQPAPGEEDAAKPSASSIRADGSAATIPDSPGKASNAGAGSTRLDASSGAE